MIKCKLSKKSILLIVYVICLVVSNAIAARTVTTGISFFGITLSAGGGAITYPITFLCTDITGELYGKSDSKKFVKYGFIGQIFASILILLTGYLPAEDAELDAAFQIIFGSNLIFATGSLVAYYISQSWDVFIFHKIRDKYISSSNNEYAGHGRWIWNNCSTITSQLLDTVIYAIIAFGFGLGWIATESGRKNLAGLIVGQYILKVICALLDTPFFYYFTCRRKK